MKNIFVSVIIFAFGVEMYSCQDFTRSTMGSDKEMLFAHLEPFSFDDFKNPPTEDPNICIIPHKKCLGKKKAIKPICAVEKHFGLLNYDHVCEIHLQNCLTQPIGSSDHVYGVPNKNDRLYYNGKEHSCVYYLKKAKNSADAIELYYKTGQVNEVVSNEIK